MWPAIWPLTIDGLGKFTKTGSALLIMAIAGGAILPLIYGKLSLAFGTQQAYWLVVPCYLYILYFATKDISSEKLLSLLCKWLTLLTGRRIKNKSGLPVRF